MKKLILLALGVATASAHAVNGAKAAELYIRLMVRHAAQLERQSNGNDATLDQSLCHEMNVRMNVPAMGATIAGAAWKSASAAEKSSFRNYLTMYLATKADDRLKGNSTVSSIVSGTSGNVYWVAPTVDGRSRKYFLQAGPKLNSLSDQEVNGLEAALLKGSTTSAESKVRAAFVVYSFDGLSTIKNGYTNYANQQGTPGVLHPEYFPNQEGVRTPCN
jgi:hypothetical protein